MIHKFIATSTLVLSMAVTLPFRASAAEAPLIGVQEVASGFTSPLVLIPLPDNSGRLMIADQIGVISLLEKPGQLRADPVLDLRSKLCQLNQGKFDERGLLGVALHPKFSQNKKVLIYYSAPLRAGAEEGWDHTSHVSEFTMGPGEKIDLASERLILQIDEPNSNHNGGRIAFGPDGFLYIAMGDGGNANDMGRGHGEKGNGQDLNTLLGKILRIDVDSAKPYSIPNDNPFKNGGGKPEIYAFGFRNPWGISFDRETKRLFAADVGQNMFEEVNIVEKGGNYGWRVKEGMVYFDPAKPNQPAESTVTTGPDGKPFKDPILTYKNFKAFPRVTEAQGVSITGGYVYRGKALPTLKGQYIFADWSKSWGAPLGVLFSATEGKANEPWVMKTLLANGVKGFIVAMGEDADGELYVLTNGSSNLAGRTGTVLKIVPPKP